jgi:Tol biopolymer transport system component
VSSLALLFCFSSVFAGLPAVQQQTAREITVSEGTSMAAALSPDGRTLAIDLQGSIWTLPAGGGAARRITDGFDDARQPAWSPDGSLIAFQGYRDGGYDIWVVAANGSSQRKITSGIHDDREPAWSPDGSRIAFSSDRAAGGNYDIWTVNVLSGATQRVTTDAANDYMPAWSPDGREIAFISGRAGAGIWVITLESGAERRHSPTGVTADAPSWGPGGNIVYYTSGGGRSSLALDGNTLTGDENVFPFRASWASPTEIIYTSDGLIRRRNVAVAGDAVTIPFSARLTVTPARYVRRVRDVDSRAPRKALGIVAPAISPDGSRVLFAALGDIWLMPVGGAPVNLTRDEFLDTEPAWSPDGQRIAYSSDKGGGFLNIWVRDLRNNQERQLTRLNTSAMGAAWSPDGSRIAFLDVDGLWRRAAVSVVDVATGEVRRIRASAFGPGTPTWSADGRFVAVASLVPYSSRFREGSNQILMIPTVTDAGTARNIEILPGRSIDSRVGGGPAWSPDGSRMALISEGLLTIVPVSRDGTPSGPARTIGTELAHSPTWTADSRRVLYQSMDKLRMVDVDDASARDLPLDLTYTPAIPTGRKVVHAGLLVDGTATTARSNMDIVIDANRIRIVAPHHDSLHAGATVVDATGLTAMPGLIEFHTHLQKDMGAAHARSWLAFGITTVRSPGGTPYEAVEDREAVDAGVRPGPRHFVTGYLMEWQRSYYKMSVAVASERHLELELQRAQVLQHDFLKSYVRMPDPQQRRMIDFAHGLGIPAASHEIYPAAFAGIDGVEHVTGTSRRGYSPKVATLGRSYGDVAAILGASGMTITPTFTLSATWLNRMMASDTSLASDPRFGLTVPWVRPSGGGGRGRAGGGGQQGAGTQGEMIMAAARSGARIVAGTDTPNPANLHAELMGYVAAGMTPYEALRTATVTPAAALALDAGSIATGKLADIVIVQGNPLMDIGAARRVRTVIANGRVFPLADLVRR